MAAELDEAAVERALSGLTLPLPRGPHRGKVGEVRASSAGSSLELHDFRAYQPGDDVRQLDWTAVARTGELILRVRQEEVSPRVEVVLDGSRSLALSPGKAARAREVALLFTRLALREGFEVAALCTSSTPQRGVGSAAEQVAKTARFDAADDLLSALRRAPPLQRCGLRVVVSDFLFETPLSPLADRLARDCAGVVWAQLLDPFDAEPSGNAGARLVDVESGEAIERLLSPAALRDYARRLQAHQEGLSAAALRVRARLSTAVTDAPVDALVRSDLAPLFFPEPARAR